VRCQTHSPSPIQILLAAILLATLTACAGPPARTDQAATGPAPVAITATSQPANVGDAKRAARAYHDSGAYARDLAVMATGARSWLSERAPQVSRPALVLDIDETALSNWEVIQRDDFGRIIGGPCRALPCPKVLAAGRPGICWGGIQPWSPRSTCSSRREPPG
jgi:hypothetical protein